MSAYKLKNVRGVPAELKQALIRDAQEKGQSVNDVALCVLAEYFQVECPSTGGSSTNPSPEGDQLHLRIPTEHPLWVSFWAAARQWSVTESSAIIRVLSAHYLVPYSPTRFGRRKKETR